MNRPWVKLPIYDCGEELELIPSEIFRLEPHPYASLGAPYGPGVDPFRLRSGVIQRLLRAQEKLKTSYHGMQLAIFDAWRPVAVQSFMVRHAITQESIARGIDISKLNDFEIPEEVLESVGRFWAPASVDPLTPSPHSTGGALDLTLADLDGNPLEMGGEIDEMSELSNPNYYSKAAKLEPNSKYDLWNKRRSILFKIMISCGFVQHPKEWWHFSYGDQHWAWVSNSSKAIYGSCNPIDSRFSTASSPIL